MTTDTSAHTVRYRRDLRRSINVLEYLNTVELQSICSACKIPCQADTSSNELRHAIKNYLSSRSQEDNQYVTQVRLQARELDTDLLASTPTKQSFVSSSQTPPQLEPHLPKIQNLRQAVQELTSSVSLSLSLLQDAYEDTKSLRKGHQIDAGQLCSNVRTLRAHFTGLKTGLELYLSNLDLPSKKKSEATQIEQLNSYAAAVKNHTPHPARAQAPRKQAVAQHAAAAKAKLRCDERSVQLTPTNKEKEPTPFNLIAKEFHRALHSLEPMRSVIEDVRRDQVGRFYIQFFPEYLPLAVDVVSRSLDTSHGTLDLGLAGVYKPRLSYKSQVAHKIPIVIHNVPTTIDASKVVDEIWSQNADRWQISREKGQRPHGMPKPIAHKRSQIATEMSKVDRFPVSQDLRLPNHGQKLICVTEKLLLRS